LYSISRCVLLKLKDKLNRLSWNYSCEIKGDDNYLAKHLLERFHVQGGVVVFGVYGLHHWQFINPLRMSYRMRELYSRTLIKNVRLRWFRNVINIDAVETYHLVITIVSRVTLSIIKIVFTIDRQICDGYADINLYKISLNIKDQKLLTSIQFQNSFNQLTH